MRVAMGDLTYIQPLGLPAFPSGFPGIPVYSGGLSGLGDCDPSTSQDTVTGLYCTPQSSTVIAQGPCPSGEILIGGVCAEDPSAGSMLAHGTTSAITQAQLNAILAAQQPTAGISSTMMVLVAVGTIALLLALRR